MKNMILALVITMMVIAACASNAYAIPALQLYIPGSEYIDGEDPYTWSSENWYTPDSSFNIQVMAVEKFSSVTLVVAVPGGQEGGVIINGSSYASGQFGYGTPVMGIAKNGKPDYMPSHSIYDTSYLLYNLGPITVLDTPVYDEVARYYGEEGITPKPGAVIELDFSKTNFSMAHFDVFGTTEDGQIKFAPFGHDAEDGPVQHSQTPEPVTMALFGLGLAGVAGLKIKKS
ncbi:MAG: choice-of-anchor N protein [Candidatus Omnitrophica bacterium]|nr:choice-of-anchor N protein [Candidatus Omnitrophota bacterium]